MLQIVNIDKNGTKTWEGYEKCGKCKGTGYIDYYKWNDDGLCFDCGGSGIVFRSFKERTPEYQAKLDAAAEKRRAKKMAEKLQNAEAEKAKFFAHEKISETMWLVLGNTYSIKDALKAEGAKYSRCFGWYFDHETEHKSLKVNANDFVELDVFGDWRYKDCTAIKVDKMKEEAERAEITSEYVGNVGDKLLVEVKLVKYAWFDTQFGRTYIYTFEDEKKHQLVWKTSSCPCHADDGNPYLEGESLKLKGTVKEQSEYKGIKQTVLTRCKVA